MKAEVAQQHSLVELTEIDAEIGRLEHRAKNLAEQKSLDEVESEHRTANDGLATVNIALEDLEAEVSKFEGEIDGVRQREDRDRSMLDSGGVNPKQLAELQHELETLQRRQSSLEDSLLEIMERREELQNDQAERLSKIDELADQLSIARTARDAALVTIDGSRHQLATRRSEVTGRLDADLVALYERQRGHGGPGAGLLQGRRCGACRIEIDRGEMQRIAAAPADEVLRCPECGAILLRFEGFAK
jgi:predicted  nucleic acid-binding Zn-ribbon protein